MKKLSKAERYALFLTELKMLRERANMSQAQLAVLLGVTQNHISRGESGSRRVDFAEATLWVEACGFSFLAFSRRVVERIESETNARNALH